MQAGNQSAAVDRSAGQAVDKTVDHGPLAGGAPCGAALIDNPFKHPAIEMIDIPAFRKQGPNGRNPLGETASLRPGTAELPPGQPDTGGRQRQRDIKQPAFGRVVRSAPG